MSSSVDGHFFCPQSHAFFPRVKNRRKGRQEKQKQKEHDAKTLRNQNR